MNHPQLPIPNDYHYQMQYRGMVATAFGIAREEGALKLWQGVTPALYRHVVYRWASPKTPHSSI